MSIVAGVDFGTLSVRVSLFDSERGRLGSGTADYPVRYVQPQDARTHPVPGRSRTTTPLA